MSAQRASAPVRLARGAAALLVIALAAVIAVRLAGRRPAPPAPAPAEPPPEGRVVDLKERVRQQEYKDGRAVLDIRGASFSRGEDGRNHLTGSVEVLNLGPAGETVSRLTADEIAYDPGSLRFTIAGHVRVESGDLVLEGDSFEYDKAAGLFGTTAGGRFSSKKVSGRAPEVSYRESADEVWLGGGFEAELAGAGRPSEALTLAGESFTYARGERRGRIEGRVSIRGDDFQGAAGTASFVVSPDESALESAVLETAAKVLLIGRGPSGEGSGEIRADYIDVSFDHEPAPLAIRASGRTELALRTAGDKTATVRAPEALLRFSREDGQSTWTASGGVRAGIEEGGALRRTLEGTEAAFDAAKVLHVSGASGRSAVADSDEARIEAPEIAVASDSGDILASGGVACVLKGGGERRAVGFFSRGEDVSVSCDRMELRSGDSASLFTGNVIVRQGQDTLRAGEIGLAGDAGRMTGGKGIAIELLEAPSGGKAGRAVELRGDEMAYRPDLRALTLSSKAAVRLPDARLEAETVTAVISRDGRTVESLAAAKSVIVSHGPYVGRSEAASYEAATGRLALTGKPVLADDKGGSARGPN